MADTQVSPSASQALPRLVYFRESKENEQRLETYNVALDLCSDLDYIQSRASSRQPDSTYSPPTFLTDRSR